MPTVTERLAFYDPLIQSAAQRYAVPAAAIQAIIVQESGGNPGAVNITESKGGFSWGLMQIQLPTARDYDPTMTADRLLWPEVNIDIGTRHLSRLVSRYNGDFWLAFAAYNSGPGNIVAGYPYANSVYALYTRYGGVNQAVLGAGIVQESLGQQIVEATQQEWLGQQIVEATQQEWLGQQIVAQTQEQLAAASETDVGAGAEEAEDFGTDFATFAALAVLFIGGIGLVVARS